MNWYIIYVQYETMKDAFNYLKKNTDLDIFIPKVEKYINHNGEKTFVTKALFQNHFFIKSSLDGDAMYEKLNSLDLDLDFLICNTFNCHVEPVDKEIQTMLKEYMDSEGIIRRSKGIIENSILHIYEGPLVNHEDLIIKIDRHKRIAKMKYSILGRNMLMPLEVPIKK